MELWGGHECTVNRVGDRYRDQTILTGHQHRIDDLDRFAALGIRRLRYPVLWERIAPNSPDEHDWSWSDERLARIAELGMDPIVGLTHHGSGPAYTSLVSDNFAALLGQFADAVVRRYPHIEHWTPVNEPLTTARFSALYGHWYPHAADDRSFWLALLNQIDATRLSMRAIRAINPAAKLVQTEDLGRYYGTEPLRDVVDFYNHRRWISWDLLAGRVTPDHPLWEEIARVGFTDRLHAIADDPCPPDLLGVNHYVTSERFVDHRLAEYDLPTPETGYHDLTAARVLDPTPAGLSGVLTEAWQRYHIPIAVTESHLGCTREEQMRWIWQSWHDCLALRDKGVDVRALTAWALIGNVDWSSLLTREAGHYEPGPFDVRSGTPRPTAIADLLRALGQGGAELATMADHPALASPGWWQQQHRLEHRPVAWDAPAPSVHTGSGRTARPILILGTGPLGRALSGACTLRDLPYEMVGHRAWPINSPQRMAELLDRHQPWAVINAVERCSIEEAERDPAGCLAAGRDDATVTARLCTERGISYTFFSSDQLFGASQAAPYREDAPPGPVNAYGRARREAERAVALACPDALVVRAGTLFSPYDQHNLAIEVEHALRQRRRFRASSAITSPTYLPDLVCTVLDLIIDGESGTWHLAGDEALTEADFVRRVAMALGLDGSLVVEGAADEPGWRAPRPASAALASLRGQILPTLADALTRHAAARKVEQYRQDEQVA